MEHIFICVFVSLIEIRVSNCLYLFCTLSSYTDNLSHCNLILES